MAFYDYGCKNPECFYTFEAEHSIKAEPLKKCPECNELTLQRLISPSNFTLSGGGWAAEGYASK